LTQLEEWCRTNQLHEKNVIEQLEPITEVVQLLQVNKKSLEDVDGIIAIVKHLNALQVSVLFIMTRAVWQLVLGCSTLCVW